MSQRPICSVVFVTVTTSPISIIPCIPNFNFTFVSAAYLKFLKLFFAKCNTISYCVFSRAINFNTSWPKVSLGLLQDWSVFPAKMQAVVYVCVSINSGFIITNIFSCLGVALLHTNQWSSRCVLVEPRDVTRSG